jgi:hypothetical protein
MFKVSLFKLKNQVLAIRCHITYIISIMICTWRGALDTTLFDKVCQWNVYSTSNNRRKQMFKVRDYEFRLKYLYIWIILWLITGFVTRLTRRVPLVEQEPLILPEHLSSPPVVSGVRVTRSLVCPFLLPLWYLQSLLKNIYVIFVCL